MTELESRTMAGAAAVLLAVSLVRWAVAESHEPLALPGDTAVAGQLLAESAEALDEARERGRPLAPGETVDPNRADEVQLDRLPGVGPSVARRIVAERDSGGPFRRPSELERVRGIGPATVARLEPLLDLTNAPPPALVRPGAAGGSRKDPEVRPVTAPSYGDPSGGGGSPAGGKARAPVVDLNRANHQELQRLPGVGPALARRILELRRARGRFRSVEELLDVRGIGPATLERIRALVRVGG